jgi:hypothetical protein
MTKSSSAIGFLGVLQIVFIVLKLCGVVNWHWALVLLSAWGDIMLSALLLAVFLILFLRKPARGKEEDG